MAGRGVVLRGGVVWCGVVWRCVVWCGVVWRGVAWCGAVWFEERSTPPPVRRGWMGDGGKGSKGRAVSSDRPMGAASCKPLSLILPRDLGSHHRASHQTGDFDVLRFFCDVKGEPTRKRKITAEQQRWSDNVGRHTMALWPFEELLCPFASRIAFMTCDLQRQQIGTSIYEIRNISRMDQVQWSET